jgi:hypothetical protein
MRRMRSGHHSFWRGIQTNRVMTRIPLPVGAIPDIHLVPFRVDDLDRRIDFIPPRRGQGRDGPVIIGRIQRRIRRGRADFFDGGLGEIGLEPNGSPYL